MTSEREELAAEVVALANVICEHCDEPIWSAIVIARHQWDALADLLAARDRRVRAEAVREAADEWPREVNTETIRRELATFDLRETPPEYRVDDWLRERADRIEAP